jgi:hypothetical protein
MHDELNQKLLAIHEELLFDWNLKRRRKRLMRRAQKNVAGVPRKDTRKRFGKTQSTRSPYSTFKNAGVKQLAPPRLKRRGGI